MTDDARASTGIAGLDDLLIGGLTPNWMYLIEGSPGTGKTTLAMQFLLDGRERGESTLYVTLSETAAELRGVAASHQWSLDGIEIFQLAGAEGWKAEDQYTLYRSEEHTSELQSRLHLVCRLLLEKKKQKLHTMLRRGHIPQN